MSDAGWIDPHHAAVRGASDAGALRAHLADWFAAQGRAEQVESLRV
jgi:hypothetical protein